MDQQHITILAHAIELNALAVEEVQSWCDKQIAESEEPDHWLIELSTSRKHRLDIVNQIKKAGALSEIEDEMYLTLVAGAYFRERIDHHEATQFLFLRFCIDWEDMTDLLKEIFLIQDELGWNVSQGAERLKSLLHYYSERFKGILNKIGIKT